MSRSGAVAPPLPRRGVTCMLRAAGTELVSLSLVGTFMWTSGLTTASARTEPKVDFRRDIQPLLAKHCVDCHGPEEQAAAFRLDRRSSVRKVPGRLQPG